MPAATERPAGRRAAFLVLIALCLFVLRWDAALVDLLPAINYNDFGKFYYSAQAHVAGRSMYGPSPATSIPVPGGQLQFLNLNPPHFHWLLLPLLPLGLEHAAAVWMVASVFALTLSVLLIARELELGWTLPSALAAVAAGLWFAATQAFFITGQLSLLLLLAMTMCWISARRNLWTRAGIWLGAGLSVKPFLLIFLPYLLATRRFKAAGATIVTAVGLAAAGLLIFGVASYEAWYRALAQSNEWGWAAMNASSYGLFERLFKTSPYYTPLLIAPAFVAGWIVIAGAVGLTTYHAVLTDRSASSVDRAFASLLVASQLISPLGWIYYLWLPAGPIAALLKKRAGWDVWRVPERITLTIASLGFSCPLIFVLAFQPRGWATATIGSSYFWATLSLWIWLLLDWRSTSRRNLCCDPPSALV